MQKSRTKQSKNEIFNMRNFAIIIGVVLILMNTTANGQSEQCVNDFIQAPKTSEKVIGSIDDEIDGGYFDVGTGANYTIDKTAEQLLELLIGKANQKYGAKYPIIYLRNFNGFLKRTPNQQTRKIYFTYVISATVVTPDLNKATHENLSKAIDKALSSVQVGSRLAIDNVSVPSEINREDCKDQVISVLLDKGYKVVAKEYLEKLMKEQEEQRSGIYNDNSTVTDNNFTAAGYFINVKVTESSLRVQVVNVSTGEYEGNATINF